MIEATSAGAILFRETRGRREYLLLKSRPGDWEFPKGGVEGDEELQQTAIREVKEEAGIHDFRLLDGFREDYDYVFEASGNTIHKTVHLFVAKSFEASAELSTEHRDLQWRDYEQAINTITQDGPRDILREAHDYLDDYYEEEEESAAAGEETVDGADEEAIARSDEQTTAGTSEEAAAGTNEEAAADASEEAAARTDEEAAAGADGEASAGADE